MLNNIMLYLQSDVFLLKAELFLRIIIAVLCGGVIGYERTNRGKGAGIRTHTIVAAASCLMMIISQYGFEDFFGRMGGGNAGQGIDPSRIAAQIVSGIGFLGAGMIFIQKNVITGLTTAAGIWAVAGIGMAIGCGMYFMGISCAVIIVVVQISLHKNQKFMHNHTEGEMVFIIKDDKEVIDFLMGKLEEFEISVLEIRYYKKESDTLEVEVVVQYDQRVNKTLLFEEIHNNEDVRSARI